MSHQTLYRKYRSQTFSELQGQEAIVTTLSQAIASQKVAHAYIFSGPRGTGKTSTARIVAKALNCKQGNGASPCLTCDLCIAITQGHSPDVIEIDAASNTGVDNIRALNDQVHFMPVEGKYKIYIIDEAHMLSTGAFNALLKTLEEPPAHTVFILATTEPHKLPITIHSRCQHFHFKKLTLNEISTHLLNIAKLESFNLSEGAAFSIARQSSGCMRDALSLLDQIVAFKGASIEEKDVQEVLGATSTQALADLLNNLVQGQNQAVLTQLNTMAQEGVHTQQLVSDLLLLCRQLMLLKADAGTLLESDNALIQLLTPLKSTFEWNRLLQLMNMLARFESESRHFSNPEWILQAKCLGWMAEPQTVQPKTAAVPQKTAIPSPAVASTPAPIPQATVQAAAKAEVPTSALAQASVKATPVLSIVANEELLPNDEMQGKSEASARSLVKLNEDASKDLTPQIAFRNSSLTEQWQAVLQLVKAQKTALFSILDRSVAIQKDEGTLSLQLRQDFKFFRDKLTEPANKTFLETLIKEVTGKTLQFTFGNGPASPQHSPSPQSGRASVVDETIASGPTHSGVAPSNPSQEVTSSFTSNEPGTAQKINHIVGMFEGTVLV